MNSINNLNYTIGKNIGNGTFGTVYNIQRSDGKKFALKKFNKESSDFDLGTLREISILQILKLKSYNTLIIEDIIIFPDKTIGIIMAKYKMDLDKAIKKNILTSDEKLNVTKKIAESLFFIKSNGIIHRDIKPENILLDKKNNPVLCDFSLSKIYHGIAFEGTHTGNIATRTFRAPEIIEKKGYSFPVDSWAFGIIIYMLFYNVNTKDLSTDEEAMYFYLHNVKKLKSSILNNSIKGLLLKDPNIRWGPEKVLKYMFKDSIAPPIIWESVKSFRISKTIKIICKNFEVEKRITRWAAQNYWNKTNCSPYSAVALACKFFETELRDFPELEEFPEDEFEIFKALNYNLFI